MPDRIKPPALRPGDLIGIVAPASNIKPDLLEDGCRELEHLGFRTLYRPGITTTYRYFSGTVERRAGEFLEMLRNPDIRAIFCARGGYGSGRIIPYLEPELLAANPKIINGSSDITALLSFLDRSGLVGFHGPMVATAIRQGENGYNRRLFLDLLMGKIVRFPLAGTSVLRTGSAEGRLIGGCLSLVVATLGTSYEIDTTDSILVLEDVDTKPYQVDRMLTQLVQAGKFDSVRGVVFGEMLNCMQNSNQGYSLEDVLLDVLGHTRFPLLFGFPTGHTMRPNAMVPFGVRARLKLEAESLFELLEPAVAVE
ncbi:MAG TPA: LD-carboxypeptidase [Terriglobia bacterium]|nr:LD-carboxypeptidase [Terriglobia bacterium]